MTDQHEFEASMYKILAYGDETYLAKCAGKSPSYYSQMTNPEDPRESIWYRAARDFHNLMELDPDRGKAALELFTIYAKRGLPGQSIDVQNARESVFKEHAEFCISEANNAPIPERIRELEESIAAQRDLLAGLRAEAKAINIRAFAKTAVNGRNGK